MTVHSVGELTRNIKKLLESESSLANLSVRGEVSNFRRYESGHCYFTLKDAAATLRCVMFRSRAEKLRFAPQNGMQLVASGNISVYERDGAYQLLVNNLAPDGAGELAVAFEQLKAKLSAEGLFAPEFKKPLPVFPRRIGVVTSPDGAVLRDIFRVGKRRMPSVQIILYGVQVQGDLAAGQIAAGIEFFNRAYPVDVLIVGRGGGSMEDLWAFNEEKVVRAIFASQIPVISAVGHETDFTLADFVADVRAPTPSAAAEIAVPDAREVKAHISTLLTRLSRGTANNIAAKRAKLDALMHSTMFTYPQRMLENRAQRLDMLRANLRQNALRTLSNKRQQFVVALEKLDAMNPARVIRRGYGIVQHDGKLVKSKKQVKSGDSLSIVLSDGNIEATVQ